MMKRLLFCAALLMAAVSSFASTEELWQRGNEYYRQKAYDSAIACYEQILTLQPANAGLYYNAGNAYYRLNNIGMAVLYYRRALRLDPGHKAAADNLLLAESRISNHIQALPDLFFISWWKWATGEERADTLGVASVVLFLIFLAAVLYRMLKRPSWLRPQLIGGVAVLWALSLLLAFVAAGNADRRDEAVVMQPDAPMVNAPQQTKAQSYIPEGTTVKVLNKKAGFAEIRLPDGRSGWMLETYITEI
jgi:tetratricopeptide (TPR) repeat protein